ncbi:MAG: PaaI family thioesterase [Rhodospirillales bacterium]
MSRITVAEFNDIVRAELPWAHEIGMHADAIGDGTAILRLPYRPSMLRPGGLISGPTIMGLADACMYAVVLSLIGAVKLAVTTSFNINFLYGAGPADLLAEGRILKLGKRLAVIETGIHCEGRDRPVAHATGTYSIPPSSPAARS